MSRRTPLSLLALPAAVGALLVAVPAAGASDDLVAFQSPSKNIGCQLGNFGGGWNVRCDIRRRDWHPPAKPRSCQLDYGQGVAVGRTGRARFVCAGDTALGSGRALGYGRSISRGQIRCSSLESGMRCVNTRDHHGFFLSRQRVSVY